MRVNENLKRVLCFGDSNTWGYIPNENIQSTYQKYPPAQKYTGILQILLGNNFEILEDGVNSRTIKFEDKRPGKENRMAIDYIKQCLYANDPLDFLIIFLGTNDLKSQFNLSTEELLSAYKEISDIAKNFKSQIDGKKPNIIYVLLPYINDQKEYAATRFTDGLVRSTQFRNALKNYFMENNYKYIDCFNINDVGSDGLHLTLEGHQKLAQSIYELLITL